MTSEAQPPKHYRFAGVEIDPLAFAVRVDGQARDCSRKAFDLLLLLCRNSGRVLKRDEVMDALWPGGQLVSDEALTQLVFRTRAVLGPYGPLLRTLRGVGLRLEAEVSSEAPTVSEPAAPGPIEPDPEPGPAPAPAVAPSVPPAAGEPAKAAARTSRRAALPGLLVLLLLVLALLAWGAYQPQADASLIDEGYGLRLEDLHASRPDTAVLLREALENEARGERERASILLEKLHAADPSTPAPAAYLAIWHKGDGDIEGARAWLARARERTAGATDLYYSLWLAFVDAEIAGGPQAVVDAAGALLDVRPQAWRMRHARAHLLEFMGMRGAALSEIQKIEVPRLGHRKRDSVIADRASMGDVEGAQAMLDRLDASVDPTMHAFLAGRLAWSRADWTQAHAHFRAAAGSAFDIARLDLQTRALEYAGVIEVVQGRDDQALASFEAARQALAGRNAFADIDLSLLLAQLHAEAGREDLARRELARALATPGEELDRAVPLAARFVAWRLYPQDPPPRPEQMAAMPDALWQAYEAFGRGASEQAAEALARARQLGIGSSRFADEARWLEWRLGLPVAAADVIDPPYPPLSRVILRRQLRQALRAQGLDGGPDAP